MKGMASDTASMRMYNRKRPQSEYLVEYPKTVCLFVVLII